jgi:cytochrome c biogenesis protein CcmG/thiol:disulfide interchange protein DsbE
MNYSKKQKLLFLLIMFAALFAIIKSMDNSKYKKIFESPLIGKTISNEYLFKSINGKKVTMPEIISDDSDIRIINFFASWCSYCKFQHKILRYINNKYQIPIYGFAWKDNQYDLVSYLIENEDFYHNTVMIINPSFAKELKINFIPNSIIVDKDNKIIAHFEGIITPGSFKYFLNQYN